MASSDAFVVTVTGRGGHASTPQDALDPIPVACELVGALQSMITRRISVFDPAVLTVASITAGTTSNVIPETAVIKGTIRAVSDVSRAIVLEGLERVSRARGGGARMHRCDRADGGLLPGDGQRRSPTPSGCSRWRRRSSERIGRCAMPSPVMGAEDWSFVLQKLPGAMAFLGARPAGDGPVAPNHSNRMLIDEDAMATGIAMHVALALST